MIEVKVDEAKIKKALQDLQEKTGNLSPVLRKIGDSLTESTKQRFVSTKGPDGKAWLLNSVLSTLLYKDGDRPLTGETGSLADLIQPQLRGKDSVEIGTDLSYAAMQQFGGTKAECPHLWGDIPERPFLGVSKDDEVEILDIIADYLTDS